MLLGQGLFFFLDGLGLAVQVLFLLLQAVFLPLQIGSAFLYFLLVFAAVFQDLFFCFQQGFALLGFRALDRLVDNAGAFFLGTGDFLFRYVLPVANTEREAHRQADHQGNNAGNDGLCHDWFNLLIFGMGAVYADRAAMPARPHG